MGDVGIAPVFVDEAVVAVGGKVNGRSTLRSYSQTKTNMAVLLLEPDFQAERAETRRPQLTFPVLRVKVLPG
jgi:hypothetical protein